MASYNYVVIQEGPGGLTKRFKAVGLWPVIEQDKTIDKTIGGKRRITYGGNYESQRLVLRVPRHVDDPRYGTYDDLKTIFTRNHPGQDPRPLFTFTDHWGKTYSNSCFGNSRLELEPICTVIEGESAYFIVEVEILLNN